MIGEGYPTPRRGVASEPGLYFLGLPWLYTWGSGAQPTVAGSAARLALGIENQQAHPLYRPVWDREYFRVRWPRPV